MTLATRKDGRPAHRAERNVPRKTMRVLGIDPAAAGPTGYGVVETDGRNCWMLRFGALPALAKNRRDDFPARLRQIHGLVARLIDEFSPDSVALESVFTALNMKTALKLAEVRGVVLLAAAQSNIPVYSYSPRAVKLLVAGYGHAGKQQMQLMVRARLGMSETPGPADAADALAVALCHIQTAQSQARFAAAGATPAGLPQAGRAQTHPGISAARNRPAAGRILTR